MAPFHIERIPMHISTTGNTLFPIISIKNLTQTLNSTHLANCPPSILRPGQGNHSGLLQGRYLSLGLSTSQGLDSRVEYLAAPLAFGLPSNMCFPLSFFLLLLYLIVHPSGPNCLVNCLQSLHLTEIAAIVNRSLHFSPFSLTQFDSFTIATFPPNKTMI